MNIKINKWLCPPGYAILLFGTIYVRDLKHYLLLTQPYSCIYNHERIHEKQADGNWILFYLKYILFYLKHIYWIIYNIKAPYKFHPMEIEAYKNQYDLNYIFKSNAGKEYKKYTKIPKEIIKNFYKDKLDYYNFILKL